VFVTLNTLHRIYPVFTKPPHDNLIIITGSLTYLTPVVVKTCPVHAGSVSAQDALQLHTRVIHDLGTDLQSSSLRRVVLAKLGTQVVKVPQPARLVQTGTDNQIPTRMPVGAHHLVTMPGQNDHILARLPVHNPHTVVVTRSQDPGQFRVE